MNQVWNDVQRDQMASTQENLSLEFANIKDADQTAHPCSVISTFLIRL